MACLYLLFLHLLSYRSTPAAYVRSLSDARYKKIGTGQLGIEICRVYKASVLEILGMTQLHIAYLQNDPSFGNLLGSARRLEIEETNALSQDLLHIAVMNGDIDLGILGLIYFRCASITLYFLTALDSAQTFGLGNKSE